MKIFSFATNKTYILGQFKINPATLVVHLQASEAIPGWEARPYGSAFDAKFEPESDAVAAGIFACLGALPTTNSLAGTGEGYVVCSIRPDGGHVQVFAPNYPINRKYGFATNVVKFVNEPPKPVTRHNSLAGTGVQYVIGQVRLGVTGEHNEAKWVHMQALEQLPGWEPRDYGSSKDVRVGGKVVAMLTDIFDEGLYIDPASLAGTGKQYMTIYIRPDGKHFQLPCVDELGGSEVEVNRSYGFAFDEKAK